MARQKPEDDRNEAFFNGAPGDYFTNGTSKQSISDILAEETNQRARAGGVDTTEMEEDVDVATAEAPPKDDEKQAEKLTDDDKKRRKEDATKKKWRKRPDNWKKMTGKERTAWLKQYFWMY